MNIPNYTDKEIKERKVDFDMSVIYGMPFIEVNIILIQRTIFQYALKDICFKEITAFQDTRFVSSKGQMHPKESLSEARNLLSCFVKK